MKKVILFLLMGLGLPLYMQAQVYICETVLFCNDAGQCVEWEICDEVESFMSELKQKFTGNFDLRSSSITLSGFSRKAEGHTFIIKEKTFLKAGGKGENGLAGRAVIPGKYTVRRGQLNLKLGDKG